MKMGDGCFFVKGVDNINHRYYNIDI